MLNGRDLSTLYHLCARVEAMQGKLALRKDRDQNRVLEYVGKAKDELLNAIREAEGN